MTPRITAGLHEAGWKVSENTVAALMREQGLAARRKRKRRAATRPGKGRWRAAEDFRIIGDPCHYAQDVRQLLACHEGCSVRQCLRKDSSTARRSPSGKIPANGLFCRSSAA